MPPRSEANTPALQTWAAVEVDAGSRDQLSPVWQTACAYVARQCLTTASLTTFPDPDQDEEGRGYENLDALARELFGEDQDDDRPPTPGERVLYALGQLHRLHLAGRLPVPPGAFAIEGLVRVLGLTDRLEFASEERGGQSFHFPSEVLHVGPASRSFPWRLLGMWEWAAEREADAYGPEGGA